MRMRKDLERKKPARRKTVQYWTEGQFRTLIEAGPGHLASRSMIPYQVLIYLLTMTGTLQDIRDFLGKRFNTPERNAKFQDQLDHMLSNLQAFGYINREGGSDAVTLHDSVRKLMDFRSVDPLYGAFMAGQLVRSSPGEKLQALESVLPTAPSLRWKVALPDMLEPGPLQSEVLQPQLLQAGLLIVDGDGDLVIPMEEHDPDFWDDRARKRRVSLPQMLKLLFDSRLASPEEVEVEGKYIAGGIFEAADDFYRYATNRELVKQEGILLRHLLRLVILAGEFHVYSGEDPDYAAIADRVTAICTTVDRRYTDHFLADQQDARELLKL
jgi:hypothetical protein